MQKVSHREVRDKWIKTDALNVIVGLCILNIVCIQISGEYIVRGASFQHNFMILGNKQEPNGNRQRLKAIIWHSRNGGKQ